MRHEGRLVKLGPGHYRVVHDGYTGGRRAGTQKPVGKEKQSDKRSYCQCGRVLNRNNRIGWCRGCAPKGRPPKTTHNDQNRRTE